MTKRLVLPFSALLLACGGAQHTDAERSSECPQAQSASGHPHGDGHAHHHGGEDATRHGSGGMVHDFSDVARFEQMFDAPERAGWQRPAAVVMMLDLAPGETAIDLGTGTGYFLPLLSVAVGPGGHVVGLDSEPAMIEHVRQRAEREGLANVEARAVTAEDPGLEPSSADAILIVDTWHHLPDRAAYAARLRDALRPGGTLVVIDFTLESPQGPPAEHRIAAEAVASELEATGLETTILEESLPHQYAVRAIRR